MKLKLKPFRRCNLFLAGFDNESYAEMKALTENHGWYRLPGVCLPVTPCAWETLGYFMISSLCEITLLRI